MKKAPCGVHGAWFIHAFVAALLEAVVSPELEPEASEVAQIEVSVVV